MLQIVYSIIINSFLHNPLDYGPYTQNLMHIDQETKIQNHYEQTTQSKTAYGVGGRET